MDEVTRFATAARDGDELALAAFIRMTTPEVWRLCAHLADRQSADDLAQDVYVRAIRALPAFRGESSARTWLLSIARRTVADALRARRRIRRTQEAMTAAQTTVADPIAGLPTVALLQHLDPDRREAFVLTQVLGLTYAEAADVCDCPIGTVRSRVARARAELIEWLHAAAG